MMGPETFITIEALFACACWLIVAFVSGWAVYSKHILDTLTERVGLCGVSFAAVAMAFRIWRQGWISDTGWFLAASLAWYAASLVWKHKHRINRQPADKGGAHARQ